MIIAIADTYHIPDILNYRTYCEYNIDHVLMFDGAVLFELKATYGLPLCIAIEKIMIEAEFVINWPQYIEMARKNGWWDFKTYDEIEFNLIDAGINKEVRQHILGRCKAYILANPHPKML